MAHIGGHMPPYSADTNPIGERCRRHDDYGERRLVLRLDRTGFEYFGAARRRRLLVICTENDRFADVVLHQQVKSSFVWPYGVAVFVVTYADLPFASSEPLPAASARARWARCKRAARQTNCTIAIQPQHFSLHNVSSPAPVSRTLHYFVCCVSSTDANNRVSGIVTDPIAPLFLIPQHEANPFGSSQSSPFPNS